MPLLFSKYERARIPNTLFKVKLQAMQLGALRKRNSLYAPFSGNLCNKSNDYNQTFTGGLQNRCSEKIGKSQSLQEFVLNSFVKKTL